MGTPDRLRWTLVVLMLAASSYHLARLVVRRRRAELDVELTHTAMGLVMAAMLAGDLTADGAFRLALAFAVPSLWFTARTVHGYVLAGPRAVAAPLGRAVGSAAMLYMLALAASARPPSSPMAGMATAAGSPLLTGLLAAGLVASCLPALSRPSVGVGCQVAMSVTAAYMLIAI